MDTFEIVDGYNKKTIHRVRKFTLDDIRALANGYGMEYHFIDKRGQLRQCRKNGGLKTWKREPERFEQSFKYGMYEFFRLTTEQMLNDLVVIVETKES